ncbi:MAG: 30S ribosomal protein S7 [Candidatus Bathyarchaeota archaeon]|nr:MAG: 30S ribosomal protein S7 [Candidatus Bathyarchaeota archaeon]
MSKKSTQSELDIKLFGKWSFKEIDVQDPGLRRYISLTPVWLPHSGGRHEHQRFSKSKVNIAERLVDNLMRHGSCGGKKGKAINILRLAFEIMHLKTGQNPIAILVRAVENSAPCEDTTRIGRGGITYHRAVDISPQRRVDLALRYLADGARNASFGNPKPVEECLADALIAAAEGDSRSYAISKRYEMERVALSSR